jgi:MFS family permease
MVALEAAALTPMSESEHQRCLRRAVIASTVGTTIEWYDFLIYSTVTGLVFGKVYFPGDDPLVSTLQAFGVFFIGFVARPIGAAIFGHYGDRIGRKATLIVTLLMTGIATAAVGLVPGYATIGIWGAVILTVLRLIQGIGVGGEWGGSVLLAMEWARTNKNRGFIASWPQFGAPAGLFLANVMVLLFSWISGDQFLTWGWRIPFLLSIVMVGVGLWIRLGILETPVFQRILAENKVERAPTIEVFRRQPREVVLTALLRPGRAVSGLFVQRLRVQLRHPRFGRLTRSAAVGAHRHNGAGFHHGADRGRVVRPDRPPADVHHRLRIRRSVHLRLFRAAQYQNPRPRVPRSVAVVHPGDDDVWAGGGADRRGVHAAAAL